MKANNPAAWVILIAAVFVVIAVVNSTGFKSSAEYLLNTAHDIIRKDDIKKADELLAKAAAYEEAKDYNSAIASYDQIIALFPKISEAYSNRGNAYYNNNDRENALKDCDKAIELNPENASAYFIRGMVYEVRGDSQRAAAEYAKAKELDPSLFAVSNEQQGER